MKHDAEFDSILVEALAEYREAEPLAGMEDRVLRRVRLQAERRKFWWQWSMAAATVAVLAIVAWIGLHDRARHKVVPPPVAQKQTAPVSPQITAPDTLASHQHISPSRVATGKTVRPRILDLAHQAQLTTARTVPFREQFPIPAPLNAGERALLALAQTDPDALRTLPRNDEEIAIAPITIPPLATESSDDKGDN